MIKVAWEMLRSKGMDDLKDNKSKECGMNKSVKGEQEWPPKKYEGKRIIIDENNPIWKEWMKAIKK